MMPSTRYLYNPDLDPLSDCQLMQMDMRAEKEARDAFTFEAFSNETRCEIAAKQKASIEKQRQVAANNKQVRFLRHAIELQELARMSLPEGDLK
jgi:hypothetical protein